MKQHENHMEHKISFVDGVLYKICKFFASKQFLRRQNITRGLSAWQLRCLIIHRVWLQPNEHQMTFIWPLNATQGQMSWCKLKDHNYTVYDLLRVHEKLHMMLHLGDTTFWSHVTLIWPWKFIQCQMSLGKVIVHRWSNVIHVYKVNWKAIYDLLYVYHTNFDHMMHHLSETQLLERL